MADARVFADGAVTIAMDGTVQSVWVGQVRVKHLKSILMRTDPMDRPEMVLYFVRGKTPEELLEVEENVRLVRTIPWITVLT